MTSTVAEKPSAPDWLWLILGLALGAIVWFAYTQWQADTSPGEAPVLAHGTWLPTPKALPAFALTDHNGTPFSNEQLMGHWTFAFFGYTNCPDVCPTTLVEMNRMVKQLPDGVTPPQVVFFSVDPERDTVAQLSQFVPYFNDAFVGVTGDTSVIDPLTRSLGILHARTAPDESQSGYLVDHSAAILLFNPEGQYTALFSAPHIATNIAADYQRILQHHEAP